MDFVRAVEQTVWSYWIGLSMVLAVLVLVCVIVLVSRLSTTIKVLVCLGLGFRVIGALARFLVLQDYYGAGDATGYFGKGWVDAQLFRQLDFTPLTGAKQWYGTEFVRTISGLVLTIIGPTMFGEFIVFSVFAFIGLVGFAVAFRRAYPTAPISRYLIWIWLFPSLWFWPSSVGKESIILMGLGIGVMGFVGRGRSINWPLLILGVVLMFGVRPQVVAVFLMTVILAQWLSFNGNWTPARLAQGIALLVVGLFGLSYVVRTIGIEEFDVQGVQEYIEGDKARETVGRTSVTAVDPGPWGAPVAVMNVLTRPFIWEASNVMVLLSSLEVLSLWGIVFFRRRNLIRSLKYWRSDRLLQFALVFVLLYSVALGFMVVNVGIVARQRVFLFPFIFLLLEADPGKGDRRRLRAPARIRRPAWPRQSERATP